MKRTNTPAVGFTGTADAIKIYDNNPDRSYLCLYAVLGDCEIAIGDSTFTDIAITLPEGVMWEPRVALTNSVWFKGDGSKLSVIAANDTPVTTDFALTYDTYNLTYNSHTLLY